ncbi:MAG: hypothetical protein WKF89_05000 [Chitinophagaceae bacterium]
MVYLDLPPAYVEAYHKEGFVIVKNFCDSSEVSRLYAVSLQDEVLHKNAMEMQDKSGRKALLSLWFTAGDNVFGLQVTLCFFTVTSCTDLAPIFPIIPAALLFTVTAQKPILPTTKSRLPGTTL